MSSFGRACTLYVWLSFYAQSERTWCYAAGKVVGDVRVSGYPKVQETFARVIGYVEQSDIHSAHVSTQASCCCIKPYELLLHCSTPDEHSQQHAFISAMMVLV